MASRAELSRAELSRVMARSQSARVGRVPSEIQLEAKQRDYRTLGCLDGRFVGAYGIFTSVNSSVYL